MLKIKEFGKKISQKFNNLAQGSRFRSKKSLLFIAAFTVVGASALISSYALPCGILNPCPPPPPPNSAPTVYLIKPTAGQTFTEPATIEIEATASDTSPGTVTVVKFFNGDTQLGEDSTSPYSFTWNSVAAGDYSLHATALDNEGTSSISDVVNIVVNPTIKHVLADFNGDGKSDISVWRPSDKYWYFKDQPKVGFGSSGDIQVPADYTGDGKADIAVFRPGTKVWYVKDQPSVGFGSAGDIPVPADYSGDGKADIAVFRPSNKYWYVKDLPAVGFGSTGDIPVPADYNGDGKVDIAVFRPSNGIWYIKDQPSVQYGVNGDIPLPGDYNGDGKADQAVYRRSDYTWHIKGFSVAHYGAAGAIPVPADYDGDGKATIALWFPSNGRWFFIGQSSYVQWGLNGDRPLELPYAIWRVFFQ